MRREPQQPRPLLERLVDEPEMELLEVAQAAVDQARRPRPDVPEAMSRCSTSAARSPRLVASRSAPAPDDPAADDEHVEPLAGERLERVASRHGGSAASAGRHLRTPAVSGSGGRRAAIRHSTSPVPTTRTPISERRVEDRRAGRPSGARR